MFHLVRPTEGTILGPLAGGATRGLVAGNLGYGYTGVNLSGQQVAANDAAATDWQSRDLLIGDVDRICGDAAEEVPKLAAESFDYES